MNFIIEFFEKNKENQIFTMIVSMYGVGLLTYFLKDVPRKILFLLKKNLTSTISISSFNLSYYILMNEILSENSINRIRNIKLVNGRWGDKDLSKTIDTGDHFIFYKKHLLLVNVCKEDSKTYEDKMIVSLTKIGRDKKFFDNLIEKIKKIDSINDPEKTKVYYYSPEIWQEAVINPKRNIDTIIIEKDKINNITNCINSFIKNEKFYLERGIPYQLGILLYGPPGTGKTSLIKAIASKYDKSLSIISTKDLSYLQNSLTSMKQNSILVIEDIDSSLSVLSREKNNKVKVVGKNEKEEDSLKDLFKGSLSDILNSLDGIISCHGRILIMTTNHIEKIDQAILRPGRVDLKVELGYINDETFKQFIKIFFNEEIKNKFKFDSVTATTLQNEFLQGKDLKFFIEKYCE